MKNNNYNNHNKNYILFGVVLLLAIFAMFIVIPQKNITVNTSPNAQLNTISVSGNFETDVNPDLAEIKFGIETKSLSASDAQNENTKINLAVIKALKKVGIGTNDIESTQYNIYPIREWNRESEKYEDRGFRVSHTIKVNVNDIDLVGELLKAGVDSGVTNVNNIAFKLSKEKENLMKTQVMKEAAQKAETKAKALAQSLNVDIIRVHTISENSYSAGIYYADRAVFANLAESGLTKAPNIAPSDVIVNANVNVVYEIA